MVKEVGYLALIHKDEVSNFQTFNAGKIASVRDQVDSSNHV